MVEAIAHLQVYLLTEFCAVGTVVPLFIESPRIVHGHVDRLLLPWVVIAGSESIVVTWPWQFFGFHLALSLGSETP